MKRQAIALLALAASTVAAPAAQLELRKGDRICLIGNTLADRMQHHGWFETLLHARFPEHELTVRNLGFSGDELTLRLRSSNFGTPDHWLTFCKADVVLAFFGYNESFGGEAGLDKFKKDLDDFVKKTLQKKYNGTSAPRLVLFSPIAHEDHKDPNLPDGKANNERLKLYTAAMAEVAKANGVAFVDLFTPSLVLYSRAAKPLTINGIHLTEAGDQALANVIEAGLFGEPKTRPPLDRVQKLRSAVNDKDFHWFHRYRTTDGYSIYGGRGDLKFVAGQTNREVANRELEVLDVMTANRDARVWALARTGKDVKVDDGNTPPFIPVVTNKPGPLPGGKHAFLGGEEAIAHMTVAKGLKVNLFASEETVKGLVKPVQMAWDPQGRLWVAVWPTYPHWKPKEPMNDKLLILEDTDGDGKADKTTIFADDLHNPTGFEFYNGGVLVAQAPDLVFLKDTDGDGKADYRERVLHGLDSADTHHTANSFVLDPGGGLYFQEGTFHHSQTETPYGPPVRLANAGVFRYEPRTQRFDVYVTFGFANPHGHVFDRWGQDIVVDGTGSQPYHGALFSGRLKFPDKHNPPPPQVYKQRTRPCPGMEVLSSRHFPDAWQGNLLVGNVIGFQGILQYKISDQGSSFSGTEVEPILSSSDPNFRPSDFKIGPDGALYFLDWHNPIIGHMQHNLRDPSRDREHGRIYRVTYEGRPLNKPARIAGEPIAKLLELLKDSEDRVRYRARIELGSRKTDDVIAAAKKWMAALDKNDPEFEHHMLEGLWLHQSHNVVDDGLLRRMLASSDFRARAAATRVLSWWRDRVPDALELMKRQAADPAPRVRLEAVRAASWFDAPEAIEVVLVASEHPVDQYIEYTRTETLKMLEPIVRSALAQGRKVNFSTEAGSRYLLRTAPLDQVLKMQRNRPVCLELLYRPGVLDDVRREALRTLAKLENQPEPRVLLDAVARLDDRKEGQDPTVVFDLVRLLGGRSAAELAVVRPDLEKFALTAKQPVMRQVGFVALTTVDNSVEKAWALATKSLAALRDLLAAVPLMPDASLRAAFYAKVEPLVDGLPQGLAVAGQGKEVRGRYVRVELPGRQKTLTLAEVEVFSDGRNVARQGKTSQSSTAYGGVASRAVDGNKSGVYDDGGQTHTKEGTDNPWWEVDLGGEYRVDAVAVYNRTDTNLRNRLNNFTLKVLDRGRNVVFQAAKQPSPSVMARIEVGGESPERQIRHAAMLALTSVRGEEAKTFKTLEKFLRDDADRAGAVRALQRVPRFAWPKEDAKPLLDVLVGAIRKLPADQRTTPESLDVLEFADALTALLPPAEAKPYRAQLGELGVRVVRIGTLLERMSYDKDVVVVRAGKPVEFIFENTDLMPHNLVLTQPGALEEIGLQSEAEATSPEAARRQYVPRNKKVILASDLLQPRETQKLSFVAPTKPGVYPIVCTYPGHWRRMYAALYVVEDLDGYLAAPDAYLAKEPVPIEDPLLKDRRPRTEWKLEDLTSAVAEMKGGRSHGNGKQMFQVASCISCHKMEGLGQEFGPDLTKLDPKLQPIDLVKELLDPSAKIDDKYRSWTFELTSGKTLTGMILEETKQVCKIIENPLAKASPIVLKQEEIDQRRKSDVSMMPKGLLDKLSREEILDLIAYVYAKGDKDHPLFRGGHDHGGAGKHGGRH